MSVIHAPKQPELTLRHLVFPFVMAAAFGALLLRLWFLQVVKAEELAERAEHFRRSSVSKLAPRGLIYDRKNVLLAGVEPKIVITAKPSEVAANPWVLAKLAKMLDVPVKKLEDKVRDSSFRPHLPTPIHVGASIQAATRIAESGPHLPGIGVETQPMRFYPDSRSFAHLMGYVWVPSEKDVERMTEFELKPADYVGKDGIEYVYERELMGRQGADRFDVDAFRRPTKLVGRDNAVPGKQLVLTIDNDLQQTAIELLGKFKGSIVAIDPRNGEVLCLASNPVYDLKLFQGGISPADWKSLNNDPTIPLFNRATQSAYAPGSTFKIVTTLAAARTGIFDPNRTVFCAGGYQVGRRFVKCLGRHGSISFRRAFAKSCNTYFIDLGIRAGERSLKQTALDMGLGVRSGIDLRSESKGILPTDEWLQRWRKDPKWYLGDQANLSIGQGEIATTPIQMANVAAMVASNGRRYRPHLVREIRDAEGTVEKTEPEVMNTLERSATVWTALRDAMNAVVDEGTAQVARIPGVSWGGKTGSAEHRRGKETHSWFVGVAPADNPQIAICVFVEAAGHGSDVAAPIARDIVRAYLQPAPVAVKPTSKEPTQN